MCALSAWMLAAMEEARSWMLLGAKRLAAMEEARSLMLLGAGHYRLAAMEEAIVDASRSRSFLVGSDGGSLIVDVQGTGHYEAGSDETNSNASPGFTASTWGVLPRDALVIVCSWNTNVAMFWA